MHIIFNIFITLRYQNQDGCTIKKMSFHSKDNQYIKDQIVFYDENSHKTYKLGNSQGTMNYYSWYKYKNKKASNQNRLGDFELMFFNSKQTLEKNPKEKDIKVEQETCAISSDKSKIYVHYVNKENSIKLNMFIDTPNIVLDSLKDRFILMFSLVQIILSCIYFIYTYLENEREELNKTRNLFINAMAHVSCSTLISFSFGFFSSVCFELKNINSKSPSLFCSFAFLF